MSNQNQNAEKIWEKGIPVDKLIEQFTIGNDRDLDLYLAPFDVLGSIAHVKMLHSIGLIAEDELPALFDELKKIYEKAVAGDFFIEEGIEDVHSQVELMLTRALGDMGKKIHSGRSRNDQVLLDLKLYARDEIQQIVELTDYLFKILVKRSEDGKNVLIPGYTHLQVAMPSSFGLWFGAYAESLTDDLQLLNAAWKITNQNPLGSAAGYGSSFPLDRQMTTDLLGFDQMNYNVVYAQMGRGKVEKTIAFALSSIASTLSKMAYDVCLFTSQNFGFVSLPDNMTTGSSIMPHKKNPDVFELLRAHCNKIQALPNDIVLMTNNLPSGYFRDLQIVKEVFIPSFDELKSCLRIAAHAIEHMELNTKVIDDQKYDLVFSVEEVNNLVTGGMPFRDAYKHVAHKIFEGDYVPAKNVKHVHEGSIGNLCNDKIAAKMETVISSFDFEKVERSFHELLTKS
ncbi:MAG: argininosuccinate lyase [Prolixibacteraceae bacterium]|nr:argininosuccinate lyase [Prolixibacteraceae bacterium]